MGRDAGPRDERRLGKKARRALRLAVLAFGVCLVALFLASTLAFAQRTAGDRHLQVAAGSLLVGRFRGMASPPSVSMGWYPDTPVLLPVSATAAGGYYSFTVPLWPLAPLGLALIWSGRRALRRIPEGHCPACRYDRAGLPPAAPCPECGRTA